MDEIDLSIALGLTPRPQQRSGVALMNVSLLGITFFFIYTCYGTSMFIEVSLISIYLLVSFKLSSGTGSKFSQ